jgi:surface antigen
MHDRVSRLSPYKAIALARIPQRAPANVPALMLLTLALSCGGCSFSYQLGSLFGKDDDKPAASATGTVTPLADSAKPISEMPPDVDLAYARAAATEVLAKGDKQESARWENPRTGARGMVTPIANAYTQDGLVCRDFLASYVREGSGEAWLQGEACRIHQGKWEVRSLKPWKRV